eukprot:TRINITY_DN2905_c1_g1_i2.p1 TRINITY_DN2905_c1_g1~~TRINITY_DN2905_c1_g1_i2.p1  ORF type:complete len:509 (-),score=139.50 TRINITY_DN2905_c1_g1_i2:1085-2611(-)
MPISFEIEDTQEQLKNCSKCVTGTSIKLPSGRVLRSKIGNNQEIFIDKINGIEGLSYPFRNKQNGMESLTKLFRIGMGPSSSHTIGPHRASKKMIETFPDATSFKVELYGSLALTGRGHLTDVSIIRALKPLDCEIIWKPDDELPIHPNGILFHAFKGDVLLGSQEVYSIGGGSLFIPSITAGTTELGTRVKPKDEFYICYPHVSMRDILDYCNSKNMDLYEYVCFFEEKYFEKREKNHNIHDILSDIWQTMSEAIETGLNISGRLPGVLKLKRRAQMMYRRSLRAPTKSGVVFAYATAVAEQNASGNVNIVTAPTCGACGVIPAVLRYCKEEYECCDDDIIRALAVAGIIGNIFKTNASISGAEAGCQAEIGVACSMAAGAATYLFGGSIEQSIRAAEIAMEHSLGLSCDPVQELVQVPCIQRNAVFATRALDIASYVFLTEDQSVISFDEVVLTMKITGLDMNKKYRETSQGGLALFYNLDEQIQKMKEDALYTGHSEIVDDENEE